MKILLINPPRWNELVGKNPSIIEKHRGFNPPLGLLYLAASIKKNTNHDVEVLDSQPFKWTYSQLENHLKGKAIDVVGITAMTFTLIDAYKTARLIKKLMPDTQVILGGTHVHLFPSETMNLEGVDYGFMGEAEFSFVKFLKNKNHLPYKDKIPGLIYKDNDGKIMRNDFVPLENLDEISFPDRNLLNIKYYNSLMSKGTLSTTIVSSRGCPFRCSFCDRPLSPITSRFRYRSAKNVVDEICECIELGIKDFLFYDDTFTVNKKRVLEICEEILSRNIEIRWDIRTRVDTVDEEMLELLKRAGCVAVHYGVEAGNDEILKVIKKGFTVEKAKEVFKLTRKVGIETLAYFMIGLPSEKAEDIQDSFDLAKELKPDYAHFTIFSPYPGTELYSLGLEKGIIKKDIWKEFSEDPKEGFKIPVWEENFTRDELYEMIVKFYKSFYLRPSYILRRSFRVKSKSEFIKKARAGLSVLFMKKDKIDTLR
ncbi:MAG: radical SAM protein [Candidatus Aminicenantes bacterium]|nr:MAG: radical SAM protein [Candidatus Aminicenantes bacterium]